MLLTPSRANRIEGFSYSFNQGKWTSIHESDIDYFLCRWCPYLLQEQFNSGPYWIRNVGKRSSFKYYDAGSEKSIRIHNGEDVPVERYIAYQLLRRNDIEPSHTPEILSFSKRALVIRYGGLGDVLMTLPALAAAKAASPRVSFDYSTSDAFVRILEGNPSVDRVFGYTGYNGGDYDLVIDLRRYAEAAEDSASVSRIDIFSRPFGVPITDYSMPYTVFEADREAVRDRVPDRAVVVQASGSIPRRTPPKSKILEIISGLQAMGYSPVVVDNVRDEDYNCVTNLTGTLTIAELFAVVEMSEFVIAGDSGVLHIANSLKKRNVGLFGCVDHKLRITDQPHCTPIQCNEFSKCGPCNDHQTRQCDRPDLCLASVPTDLILEKVAE